MHYAALNRCRAGAYETLADHSGDVSGSCRVTFILLCINFTSVRDVHAHLFVFTNTPGRIRYLTRIQQRSTEHPELDGAWMRAFDYDKWEVWASAADIGWGPWCVETGWMNSWIVSTLTMHTRNESMWDLTGAQGGKSSLAAEINALVPFFLPSAA